MRVIVATALFCCVMPAMSQESRSASPVLEHALRALPGLLRGLGNVPNPEDMRQYAIADMTVGGAEEGFREAAAAFHSTVIADELLASYREVTRANIRIGAADVNGARVLPLDEFASGSTSYDWTRLNEKYPNVKAILRVSAPATAGGSALVRVEVISREGSPWGSFMELQSEPDGSWRAGRARSGALWK